MKKALLVLSLVMIVAICSCSNEDRNKLVGTDTGGTNPPVVVDTGTVVNPPVVDTGTVTLTWEEQFEFDYSRGDLFGYTITDIVYVGPNTNPMSWGNIYGDFSWLDSWRPKNLYTYKINGHTVNQSKYPMTFTLSIPGKDNLLYQTTQASLKKWVYPTGDIPYYLKGTNGALDDWCSFGFLVYSDALEYRTDFFYEHQSKYRNYTNSSNPDPAYNGFHYTAGFDSAKQEFHRITIMVTLSMKNISNSFPVEFSSGH